MKFPSRILPVFLGLLLLPTAFAYGAGKAPERDLTVGARGSDVVWVQDYLMTHKVGRAAEALSTAGATGYFGPLTRAAIAEFQAAKGIAPAHGYFGPKTRAVIAGTVASTHAPTFVGKIEAVDTACFADGICSVTVDGKKVILLTGMRIGEIPPVGSLKGVESIGDLEAEIGATARVYATTTTEGGADYTLYGSKDYYVEVVAKVTGEPITVRGTIGCLPPKETDKPVIAMCAFGLKAADGNYYSLRDEFMKSDIPSYSSETTVEVTGTFTKGEDATWKSVGTIAVKRIKEVK